MSHDHEQSDGASEEQTSRRTCVLCREAGVPRSADARPLLRLLRVESGAAPNPEAAGANESSGTVSVVPDLAAKGQARGAWVHHACLLELLGNGRERSERRLAQALSRSFRASVEIDGDALRGALRFQAHRRCQGLLLAARRARCLAFGGDDVEARLGRGEVALVVLALDARAAGKTAAAREAAARAQLQPWGNKVLLASLLGAEQSGRAEVAVVAILDHGVARAFRESAALELACTDPNGETDLTMSASPLVKGASSGKAQHPETP